MNTPTTAVTDAIRILHSAARSASHDAGAMAIVNTLHNAASYILTQQISGPRGVAHLWANLIVGVK